MMGNNIYYPSGFHCSYPIIVVICVPFTDNRVFAFLVERGLLKSWSKDVILSCTWIISFKVLATKTYWWARSSKSFKDLKVCLSLADECPASICSPSIIFWEAGWSSSSESTSRHLNLFCTGIEEKKSPNLDCLNKRRESSSSNG